MKKIIFTLSFLLVIAVSGFSQTTYYWVGGPGSVSFTSNSNWNTQLDGMGTFRAVAPVSTDMDVLIIDGTNIAGTPSNTGPITVALTGTFTGQLILQNSATLIVQRPAGGGGTGTFTINGDGNPGTPDLVVGAGSSLTINSPSTDGSININLLAGVTGSIGGTISIANSGAHRITSQTAGGLVFTSGSIFNSGGTSTTYPFGSSTQGINNGVVFEAGSSLMVTTARSPMGGTSTHQSCYMSAGSNYYLKGGIVASSATGSWSNLKTYGNLFIQAGATFTSDGPFYKIDTLTIDNGCKLTTHSSGNTPVLGNLVVNGTLDAPGGSSNALVLGGSVPQSVSGGGSIVVPSLTVGNYSDVSLSRNMVVATTCSISGKLNFGTSQLSGAATFSSRVSTTPVTYTGTTTTGSFQLTGVTTPSGVTGLYITGPGIAANTNVVGFSSSNSVVNLSKPATGNNIAATYTFSSDSATLVTANPNGLDSLTGSVIVTGAKTFQTGTNYIINAATTKPFGISSVPTYYTGLGNVTLNAAVTLNYNARITGTLTLNSGKLTVLPTDSVRILYGTDIGGAPFSSSKYVISSLSGANAGVLRIDNIATAKLFPVGSSASYLPAILTPTSPMNYAVSVFQGVTADGTPTGTPVTAGQKATIVDAVWTINRTSGSGDCAMTLNWPASLEGSSFSGYSDAMVGIERFNGTDWDIAIGSGNNTANTATATYSSFSPFVVGQAGASLPVIFGTITAATKPGAVTLTWNVKNEEAGTVYSIEKSLTGTNFTAIGSVKGNNKTSYSFVDMDAVTGKIFYRLKLTNASGAIVYSHVIVVVSGNDPVVGIYPNPVTDRLNVSGLAGNSVLTIANSKGQKLLQQKTDASSINVSVADFKPGFYLVSISKAGAKTVTKTFVKQ
ncbi:MAG: T9SS type A sorting domain-containing protein [Chitinophagaceae bacterium]